MKTYENEKGSSRALPSVGERSHRARPELRNLHLHHLRRTTEPGDCRRHRVGRERPSAVEPPPPPDWVAYPQPEYFRGARAAIGRCFWRTCNPEVRARWRAGVWSFLPLACPCRNHTSTGWLSEPV